MRFIKELSSVLAVLSFATSSLGEMVERAKLIKDVEDASYSLIGGGMPTSRPSSAKLEPTYRSKIESIGRDVLPNELFSMTQLSLHAVAKKPLPLPVVDDPELALLLIRERFLMVRAASAYQSQIQSITPARSVELLHQIDALCNRLERSLVTRLALKQNLVSQDDIKEYIEGVRRSFTESVGDPNTLSFWKAMTSDDFEQLCSEFDRRLAISVPRIEQRQLGTIADRKSGVLREVTTWVTSRYRAGTEDSARPKPDLDALVPDYRDVSKRISLRLAGPHGKG